MITDVLIEMQDNFNNTFDDSDYEQFTAETKGTLPSGEPAFICAWCDEPKCQAEAVEYTANKKLETKTETICKSCHDNRFRLSETVQTWADYLNKYKL